jgi:hypothetical protein
MAAFLDGYLERAADRASFLPVVRLRFGQHGLKESPDPPPTTALERQLDGPDVST